MSVVFRWKVEEFESLVRTCERDTATPYILKYMPRNGLILEAGCGLGRYVKFLDGKGLSIIGLELNYEAVSAIKKFAPELDVAQGDVAALPFKDNSISGIISLGVVEHFIEGPAKPLKEMYRVLKPGHYLVITVPSFNYIRRVKHALGLSHWYLNPVRSLKRLNRVRKFLGKEPIVPRYVPYKCRDQVVADRFFQYFFTKREFEEEVRQVGFTIVESVPIAWMDGVYHEFGSVFVLFENWTFHPTILGELLNSVLKRVPFCHNHMHLCVVRK